MAVAAVALALALAVGGCGGGERGAGTATALATTPTPTPTATVAPAPVPRPAPVAPPRPDLPAGLDVRFAGAGARGAWVLRREGHADDPVVVFLHGWTAVDPARYGPWLSHLVRRGSTVVYPVYQDAPFLAPALAFDAAVAGIRAALTQEGLPRGRWVVAGHSAGGALAADYAARARALGLPPARGVFAAYPGRRLRGFPLRLPEADPAGIPPRTRLVALYGADDQTVGAATAKRTVARAPARTKALVRVDDPAVDDHLGPQRAGPSSRRAFWRRLDALVTTIRR